MIDALIGTRTGVYRLRGDNLTPLGLAGQHVSAVHACVRDDGVTVLLAGTYGDGLFRSDDDGKTWRTAHDGLTARALRTIRPDPFVPTAILCGTEPGRIFRSDDAGASWNELSAISALSGVEEWYLPYSPRAGAVRNIYRPTGTDRLLASVEVGGLLDSPDRGTTWTVGLVAGDSDIHYVTGHPDDPELLYAALGWASLKSVQRGENAPPLGGIARSRDGGATWEKLHTHYTRAIVVPPTRPDLLLAGPAAAVGEGGRIEVSPDGGDTWTLASDGIDSPMDDMVEEFVPAPDGSTWAIRSGGTVLGAEPGEWRWMPVIGPEHDLNVRSVAFIPGA